MFSSPQLYLPLDARPDFSDPADAKLVRWGEVVYHDGPLLTLDASSCSLLAVDFGDAAVLSHVYSSFAPENRRGEAHLDTVVDLMQRECARHERALEEGTALIHSGEKQAHGYLLQEIDGTADIAHARWACWLRHGFHVPGWGMLVSEAYGESPLREQMRTYTTSSSTDAT